MSVLAATRPSGRARLRARSEPALLMASLAWVAAIIHGAASAQHVAEWPLAAAFFGALAVGQFGLGAWLWARADTAALIAGAAASAAVVALWAVTRTAGLPFGPEAGHPESAGVLDVVASADELLLAACAAALMHDRGQLPLRPAVMRAALIVSVAAAMLAGGHSH
jgi:hypothetical protein